MKSLAAKVSLGETLTRLYLAWGKSLSLFLPLALFMALTQISVNLLVTYLPQKANLLPVKMLLGLGLGVLFLIIMIALFAKAAGYVYQKPLSNLQSLELGIKKLPAWLATIILATLMLALPFFISLSLFESSFIFLRILGIFVMLSSFILGLYLSAIFPLVILENTAPWTAIAESFRLVNKRFGLTLIYFICVDLTYAVVAAFFVTLVYALENWINAFLLEQAITVISYIFLYPFMMLSYIVLYTTLKPEAVPVNLMR